MLGIVSFEVGLFLEILSSLSLTVNEALDVAPGTEDTDPGVPDDEADPEVVCGREVGWEFADGETLLNHLDLFIIHESNSSRLLGAISSSILGSGSCLS